MALVTHKFKLDLTPGASRQVLYTSQGDIGRPFEADLYWNGSPWTATGTTANIRGKKPDDTVFDYTATVSGTAVTFETTEQMTIISGPVECELVFSNDGDVIASANFVLIVEESPYNPDALSESDVDTLGELVSDQIPPAVGDWLEDNVSVAPTSTVIGDAVTDYLDTNGIQLARDDLNNIVKNEGLQTGTYNIVTPSMHIGTWSESNHVFTTSTNRVVFDAIQPYTGTERIYIFDENINILTVSFDDNGNQIAYDWWRSSTDINVYNENGYIDLSKTSVFGSSNATKYLVIFRFSDNRVINNVSDITNNVIIVNNFSKSEYAKETLKEPLVMVAKFSSATPQFTIDVENSVITICGTIYIYTKNGDYYSIPVEPAKTFNLATGETLVLDLSGLQVNTEYYVDKSSALKVVSYRAYNDYCIPVANARIIDNVKYTYVTGPFSQFIVNEHRENVALSSVFSENQLIAHRGGNVGEENTIACFENAIGNGYKAIEFDVQFTSDNVPVLNHDTYIVVNNVNYTISENTYADLVALKPNLATMREAMLFCKKNNVICDVDFARTVTDAQIAIVYNLIKTLGMRGRCFITCYAQTARKFIAIDTNLIICVSMVSDLANIAGISDIVNNTLLCLASTEYTDVTQELVNAMHNAGIVHKVWTVDTQATADTFWDYGVDMIITNSILPNS